jgi:hypothetical protein
MDRKGFNYAVEDLGFAVLDAIASRGGRFWMAHRNEVVPLGLTKEDGARYTRLAECQDTYYLFDLYNVDPDHVDAP